MRILHTSDWHLGVHHGATSRGPDHDAFLTWLETELAQREIDTLIVAGDVFDSMQPSADAQGRYYRFLGRLAQTGVAQVVIVGGNHDSASRLDAPAEVLAALDVHVVGGIRASEESWERCVLPLKDRSGEVRAVALAVPYVHEFRLGVRTTDLDHAAVRAQFTERFSALYTRLVERARERWPGLPIVATGHLTLGTARREDYPHEIHQVGQIDGLPVTVFDSRIQYAALGHIHRAYPVGPDRRAWYCGSPIAFSLPEAASPRKVLVVELDPDPQAVATVTPVEVPAPRALRELRAAPDALIAQIGTLTWTEALPPLLFCRAVTDALPSDLMARLHDALVGFAEGARPALVELRQERATAVEMGEQDAPPPALNDLDPAEVFATLCRARGLTETEALNRAFASLCSATDDDFQAMIEQARGRAS
ncbi:MAG: exonuclease SbcD [Myxococcota bacterium]|jgi:exonuclease SbcD